MISTRDALIGFFLALAMLFLMIINGVGYPFTAAAQPQPETGEPENRQ